MMAVKNGKKFAGAEQVGWLAYNLTSDPTHGLGGWSDAELAQYLSTGHADGHGPASGPMAEVVEDSLRYLKPDDIHAMVTYLRGVPAQPDGPPAVAANGAPQIDPNGLGARLFAQACAGCHLPNGNGRQSPWAALAGSQTAGDPAGTNLVQVLTQGTRSAPAMGRCSCMPSRAAIPTRNWRPSATTRSASSASARAASRRSRSNRRRSLPPRRNSAPHASTRRPGQRARTIALPAARDQPVASCGEQGERRNWPLRIM